MNNDKDSAVLAEKANIEWLAQQLLDWPDKRTDEAKTMAIGTLHRMASATILSQHQELAALRQPTQSDALKAAGAAIRGLLDITSEYNLDSEQAGRAYAALHDIGTALQEQSK